MRPLSSHPPPAADISKPERKRALLAELGNGRDFWVFAYGSLIWNPDFRYAERRPARIHGYHRRFCVYSHHYRGTEERPGLVLGLAPGGSCAGIVYRVAAADTAAVVDYLWEREMISGVYEPHAVCARAADARIDAHTFVADPHNSQYAGALSLAQTAALVRQGIGARGRCVDYLADLVTHLDALGLADGPMHRLLKLARDRD